MNRVLAMENSAKVVKAYEVKVAELSFENDDLRAQLQELRDRVEKQSSTIKDLELLRSRLRRVRKRLEMPGPRPARRLLLLRAPWRI